MIITRINNNNNNDDDDDDDDDDDNKFLFPNGKDQNDPKNYCPITCLPKLYNLLTSAITNRLYIHLDKNNILPIE